MTQLRTKLASKTVYSKHSILVKQDCNRQERNTPMKHRKLRVWSCKLLNFLIQVMHRVDALQLTGSMYMDHQKLFDPW
jgi:hypothetical protein